MDHTRACSYVASRPGGGAAPAGRAGGRARGRAVGGCAWPVVCCRYCNTKAGPDAGNQRWESWDIDAGDTFGAQASQSQALAAAAAVASGLARRAHHARPRAAHPCFGSSAGVSAGAGGRVPPQPHRLLLPAVRKRLSHQPPRRHPRGGRARHCDCVRSLGSLRLRPARAPAPPLTPTTAWSNPNPRVLQKRVPPAMLGGS